VSHTVAIHTQSDFCGVLEGQSFPVIFDTEVEYGEDAGTIRNLTVRYLTEVKKGAYEGKPMNRWHLSGLEGYQAEKETIKTLINSGKISVPTSSDGRYTNVASINVKDKIFNNKEAFNAYITAQEQKLIATTDDVEKAQIQRDIVIATALNK